MERPRYNYGDEVRVIRNVRNDGTYPGLDVGAPLVRRGSTGFVINVGTFLQDQIIYTIHFVDVDRIVGCRDEEIIDIDENWTPSKYEFRDKVISTKKLVIGGDVIVNPGDEGEVLKVLRDHPEGPHYHIRFPGRTLQVPEDSITEKLTELDQQAQQDDI